MIPGDRLHKIRPTTAVFMQHNRVMVPFENLAINETLVLFKGRLPFQQYIPSKRSRFGVKLFVLADCETGCVLNFITYVGGENKLILKS